MTNSRTESPDLQRPFSSIGEVAWNGLCDSTGPFVDWRFLASAEEAGCTGADTGWRPCPLTEARDDGSLICAAPAWFKDHSHGEFVFDFAWAQASGRAGMPWYPKLLVAAPFSPVTGPRLLGSADHPSAALDLVRRMETLVGELGLWSAGVNFCDADDADILREAGWLERFDWQYHWRNDGYRDFDEFLSRLRRKPRKNIRAERRRVHEQGWRFRWRHGASLDECELDLVDRCYQTTFAVYGNLPSLNRDFFEKAAARFGREFLVCIAERDGEDLACAVFWRDAKRLYGRYWGSLVETRDVHFETCYYQGIDYCIREGIEWFEPGAQGEHKIRRGFLPRPTRSFHYIRHPGLREGVSRWLAAEGEFLEERSKRLAELDPFRTG
ncbi:GNAT family N-acetyltransferase [Wenzhouxiangella sediminis]|uniref:GNAT family N-acetyltransferase n=1 Tax=Wenzhouxiangella sediminis TaxID=1792836 RepID=A0A3E1KBC3_9GAMM|nr:peptidogalycan biosysnthesis protein [Wenzhouxiangella sediminis]RFF31915.1 GNAT family N-acetyltransferase [Wenzhouxiangella sediminis]